MNNFNNWTREEFVNVANVIKNVGFTGDLNLRFLDKETPYDTLIALLNIFKSLSPSKSNNEWAEINSILMFLYICKQGDKGALSKELEEIIGSAQSTVSRNLIKLSVPNDIYNKKGRGLIKDCRDPHERRRNKWFLTSKGEALKNKINEVFQERER